MYRKYGHILMSVFLMGLTYVKEERVTFVFLVDNIFSLILLCNRTQWHRHSEGPVEVYNFRF